MGQKLTAKQKAAKVEAARQRELQEQKRREAAQRTKKIFTVVVCVILVLALGIPTVAIMAMGLEHRIRGRRKPASFSFVADSPCTRGEFCTGAAHPAPLPSENPGP